MKKVTTIATIAVLILAVLFSALPSGVALAKADVTVTIKNNTGGTISGRIGSYNFTFDPGMYEISLPEGKYEFYVSTPCGSESGQFNLNVSKHLFLSCKNDGEVSLYKPDSAPACEMMLWVGAEYQWFEPDTSYWPMLLGDPGFEAEMKCFDSSLPIAPGFES